MNQSIEGFFYGLYMDSDLLRSLGFSPGLARMAVVHNYELDLHGFAKLVPKQGGEAWGMLIQLPESHLRAMYAFETTKHYKPERITVVCIESGQEVEATCYNVPVQPEFPLNKEYREKLVQAMKKLGFPQKATEYVCSLS
ncbi:MAG: gamma-glutamylcyclotransferase [Gammaproteobacteria bacterium]|nr:gamma-glutamylcyclotransferase [Gammaproteobacteria bacterium]MDH5802570.1 gamma-glutamylcyclotransferase [Gammaproteobacteria bacterium]